MSNITTLMRSAFFSSCVGLGKLVRPRGVPVLLYHSIDTSGSPISTTPQNFAWQMSWLARHGWYTMTLDELVDLMRVDRLPQKRFIITFDDGFRNLFTEALPILQTFGFSATVYVATEFTGRTNSYVTTKMPQYPMLTWDDLVRLKESGWRIESHGHSHTNLPELPIAKVKWELALSRDLLKKHLDVDARHFCYPRGKLNNEIALATRESGYHSAASLRVGLVRTTSDPWKLERLPVNDRATPLHFKALFTEPYAWFAASRRAITGKY